jgi:hypothetical protein
MQLVLEIISPQKFQYIMDAGAILDILIAIFENIEGSIGSYLPIILSYLLEEMSTISNQRTIDDQESNLKQSMVLQTISMSFMYNTVEVF